MRKTFLPKKLFLFLIAVLIVLLIAAALSLNIFLSKSGDYLVSHLFDSMGLRASYDNNCDFFDAFIFKGEDFKNIYVGTEDFPTLIFAKKAHISFDYRYLVSKAGVILNCLMYQPVIDLSKEKDNIQQLTEFLPEELINALIVNGKISFDSIEFNVLLYDIYAEILKLQIVSKDFSLVLSGKISEKGALELSLKGNFSREIGDLLPTEVLDFLEDIGNGGYRLEVVVKNDPQRNFFSIDSPRLKFSLGK